MRKLIFLLGLLGLGPVALSQPQPAVVDSFKHALAKATTDREKFELTGQLAKLLMNINPAEADIYGKQLIEIAENSRDRKLMIEAQLVNGERYSYLAGRKDNIAKSIAYYNKGLALAKENKIDDLIVKAYLALSEITRRDNDYAKALDYTNQANSYSVIIKNDSITACVHIEYGNVYISKKEKLLALRNYLAAVRIAEELKNVTLLRLGYTRLSVFYALIEDYDRAIDYQTKSFKLLDEIKTGQVPYLRVQELAQLGELYARKKDNDMAFTYYNRSLALGDSVHFEPIKTIAYQRILNLYINNNQPRKALDYFNEHPQLKDFLVRLNFSHFVDQSYGYIYLMLGQYDSAKYYYGLVRDFFEKDVNPINKFSYYYQLGLLYRKTGDMDKSLDYFNKSKLIADQMGDLEQMKVVVNMLDSVYQQMGDYRNAMHFASLNTTYKDSLDKMGREKDLMQIEAADEQERQARLERERLDQQRRRNNIQYMTITFGIIILFILLTVLGMFKVSAGAIRAIGFFAFLLFFEFIFLIFKKNIYSITHGEPWKDLAFMLGLAALLVPLHHWLEKRVLHYLTSHNRLTNIFKRSGSQEL